MTMGRGYQFIYTGLKCAWHKSTISAFKYMIGQISFGSKYQKVGKFKL